MNVYWTDAVSNYLCFKIFFKSVTLELSEKSYISIKCKFLRPVRKRSSFGFALWGQRPFSSELLWRAFHNKTLMAIYFTLFVSVLRTFCMMRSIGVIFKEEEKPKCCVVKKKFWVQSPSYLHMLHNRYVPIYLDT